MGAVAEAFGATASMSENVSQDTSLVCGGWRVLFDPTCIIQEINQTSFPPPPAIAGPPSPGPDALTLAPVSGDSATQTINDLISQGVIQSQQTEQSFFNSMGPATNLNWLDASTWPLWVWALLFGAGFVGFKVLEGRL